MCIRDSLKTDGFFYLSEYHILYSIIFCSSSSWLAVHFWYIDIERRRLPKKSRRHLFIWKMQPYMRYALIDFWVYLLCLFSISLFCSISSFCLAAKHNADVKSVIVPPNILPKINQSIYIPPGLYSNKIQIYTEQFRIFFWFMQFNQCSLFRSIYTLLR